MITTNGAHLNGVHVSNLWPPCPSDYEPAPANIPAKQTGWRDQFPAFTHNLSWVDADGLSHSMTLRSDSLQDLMADLKLLKNAIKQSRQQHAEAPLDAESDVKRCAIHGVDMPRRFSKRNQGHFFGHVLPDNTFCYGRKS